MGVGHILGEEGVIEYKLHQLKKKKKTAYLCRGTHIIYQPELPTLAICQLILVVYGALHEKICKG